MKWTHFAVWAVCGMSASGATVYATTPDGGFAGKSGASPSNVADSSSEAPPSVVGADTASDATFVADGTVRVEGRLGHSAVSRSSGTESFVMLELKGSETGDAKASTTPVHLGLVIDRSGSMRGRRMENAKAAALSAVERLADGDTVSVVAFDTHTTPVVAPTRLDPSSRETVRRSIEGISLGGDTCISCGIEASAAFMDTTPDHVRRMVVLSDGDTNSGVRDIPGMQALAQTVHARGPTVTSIGVDLAYNERMMAAIATGGEGNHHFVAEPSDLARVFDAEALSARGTVAENVEAHIRLERGVELIEVLDRSFTRSGEEIVVPVGGLSKGEVKTVLCRVRVPAASEDALSVASIDVRYRDLVEAKAGRATGSLRASGAAATGEVDPFVAARVERSRTASALEQANALFRQGKLDEARATLGARQQALQKVADHLRKAPAAPSMTRAKDASLDFDKQLSSINRAEGGFATPPPPSPAPAGARPSAPKPSMASPFESNAKENQSDAFSSRR